jgi:Cu(I)/Ag(I) efflux system membrane protein CusA/SilA
VNTSLLGRLVGYSLERRLVTALLLALITGYGLYVMPFSRAGTVFASLPSDPVSVDAIPDIGERQQIVFAEWPGRSPTDVEDQVTTPLTARLLGVPNVKTVRGTSMFGFSSVYVIFDDDADFYESRSRVLEKLSSIASELPEGVVPELGPDASALGQIFWYTLEAEGFSLEELRSYHDFHLRYALLAVDGVAEVASVGGLVNEIQVDVDPVALGVHGVTLMEVENAVMGSNLDVGARELVLNGVEYVVRGAGRIEDPSDIASSVIRVVDGAPLSVREVARVSYGPAPRRGALDKMGVEATGGVVTARYGENPQAVIARVKAKLEALAPTLPSKVLPDGRTSQMRVVPFYDRTTLIEETVGTLGSAVTLEVLITILVILLLLLEVKTAFLVAATLPIGVLLALGMMKVFGIESNIMSLGGIIIAIGTMVDMGIVLSEGMLLQTANATSNDATRRGIVDAVKETGSAVLTAVSTTVVSFLPVFAMTGPEARLFRPLAYTKTFAIVASIITALFLLPTIASFVYAHRGNAEKGHRALARAAAFFALAVVIATIHVALACAVLLLAVRALVDHALARNLFRQSLAARVERMKEPVLVVGLALIALVVLTAEWLPLGIGHSMLANLLFVGAVIGLWIGALMWFLQAYPRLLSLALAHKRLFATLPISLVGFGLVVWLGFSTTFAVVPRALDVVGAGDWFRGTRPFVALSHAFPGIGQEFMPPLDEGTFLFMPSVMPHASIGEALDVLQKQDRAIGALPEIALVVGKIGRAETALDPAPLSMIETVIQVKPEYGPPDDDGERKRQWRDHIRSMDDIWDEIARVAAVPGATGAPKLMPIATRIVMLQSGMRAPLGVKVGAASVAELSTLTIAVEDILQRVPGVIPASVVADRVTGTPYVEIHIDRERARRLGVRIADVQSVIETALGGKEVTTLIDGRVRTPVRVRYARETRDTLEALTRAFVPVDLGIRSETSASEEPGGMGTRSSRAQVPLSQIASVEIVPGPLMLKSEDGRLVAYVTLDKDRTVSEVDIAERVDAALKAAVADGSLSLPAGASTTLAGTFENQVRSARTLMIVLPVALALILVILLLQLKTLGASLIVFSSVAVAWAGGFVFLWMWSALAGSEFSVLGVDVIGVFRPTDVKLSVAVWVGFIALFGIATDDGVIMSTFVQQRLEANPPRTVLEVREAVSDAAHRRIRPCLMTTATTVLALLPVLTSTGRGADVMTPMALPTFGGMIFELLTLFVVPVLASAVEERRVKRISA